MGVGAISDQTVINCLVLWNFAGAQKPDQARVTVMELQSTYFRHVSVEDK